MRHRMWRTIGKIIIELIGVVILACVLQYIMYVTVNFLTKDRMKVNITQTELTTELSMQETQLETSTPIQVVKPRTVETMPTEQEVSPIEILDDTGGAEEAPFPITIYDEYHQNEDDVITIIE